MPGIRDRLKAWGNALAGGAGSVMSGGGPRVAGPPRSPNGASSFHLIWNMPRTAHASRLVEVSVLLEVLRPPQVQSLYFWALQVDFDEDGLVWGGAHTGLQWNSRFPRNAAVNWGGYATQQRGGAVLPGSDSALPAFSGDPNTMRYDWQPGRAYRFRVFRSPEFAGAWRSEVTDLTEGRTTAIRDLFNPRVLGRRLAAGDEGATQHGGYLRQPMVWSEVFADCDAPSVVVRWSDLAGRGDDGTVVRPEAVSVNYQTHQAGGCANTTVRADDRGFLQITSVPREVPQGGRLPLSPVGGRG